MGAGGAAAAAVGPRGGGVPDRTVCTPALLNDVFCGIVPRVLPRYPSQAAEALLLGLSDAPDALLRESPEIAAAARTAAEVWDLVENAPSPLHWGSSGVMRFSGDGTHPRSLARCRLCTRTWRLISKRALWRAPSCTLQASTRSRSGIRHATCCVRNGHNALA